jgi:hypothetical protein
MSRNEIGYSALAGVEAIRIAAMEAAARRDMAPP